MLYVAFGFCDAIGFGFVVLRLRWLLAARVFDLRFADGGLGWCSLGVGGFCGHLGGGLPGWMVVSGVLGVFCVFCGCLLGLPCRGLGWLVYGGWVCIVY